jgi:Na+/H+ antiporter NhaD/arsenite permease-like protein
VSLTPFVLAQHGGAAAAASTTDPTSQLIVAVVLVLLFAFLAWEKAHRTLVAFAGVALLWAVTYLTPYHLMPFEATAAALDLNVLVLLAAMMALVGVLKSTGVFGWAVARLLAHSAGRPTSIVRLTAWFTGAVSAVADNLTTVIFVTPMVVGIARRMAVNPAAFILPMIMAANIGGTATLIGDPPNMLIGSGAGLSFMDFVANLAAPVLVMLVVLDAFGEWRLRRALGPAATEAAPVAELPAAETAITDPVLLRWMLAISLAVFVGFFLHDLTGMPPAVPATLGAATALIVQDVLYLRRHRPSHEERVHGLLEVIEKEIEWPTLAFFGALFILVGAAVNTGLIGTIATGLVAAIEAGRTAFALSPEATLLMAALVILWAAGLLSSLVDNIPFVAVSIPIVAELSASLSAGSTVLWWALALGACLGGNGTLIGASANVTAVGLAERAGTRIGFGEFARFGMPVMLGTLVLSTGFLILYVHLGQWGAFWATMGILLVVTAAHVLSTRFAEARRSKLPPPGVAGAA